MLFLILVATQQYLIALEFGWVAPIQILYHRLRIPDARIEILVLQTMVNSVDQVWVSRFPFDFVNLFLIRKCFIKQHCLVFFEVLFEILSDFNNFHLLKRKWLCKHYRQYHVQIVCKICHVDWDATDIPEVFEKDADFWKRTAQVNLQHVFYLWIPLQNQPPKLQIVKLALSSTVKFPDVVTELDELQTLNFLFW